jgi:hypothetical protein
MPVISGQRPAQNRPNRHASTSVIAKIAISATSQETPAGGFLILRSSKNGKDATIHRFRQFHKVNTLAMIFRAGQSNELFDPLAQLHRRQNLIIKDLAFTYEMHP